MDIRAAEISAILKDQIKNFGKEAEVSEVGQVLSVGDERAVIEYQHAPCQPAQDPEVVLDDHHGEGQLLPQPQQGDHHVVLLLDHHPCRRFVEQ